MKMVLYQHRPDEIQSSVSAQDEVMQGLMGCTESLLVQQVVAAYGHDFFTGRLKTKNN